VPGYQACNETRPRKCRQAAGPVKNQENFTAEYGKSTKHAEQFSLRMLFADGFQQFPNFFGRDKVAPSFEGCLQGNDGKHPLFGLDLLACGGVSGESSTIHVKGR